MKILSLLLLLTFVSCKPEINYKDLTISSNPNSKLKNLQILRFNPQIEMMIAFLWPKDLGPKDEEYVIEVISTSREISIKKETYLQNLYKLQLKYDEKNCDCHLVGLCEDDIDMDDILMDQCDEITFKQDENNQILASLTLDHEKIKELLSEFGAINIDVGVDDDYLDIGSFNPETGKMHINKFAYNERVGPLDFIISSYVEQDLKAEFIFNIDKETFSGDLGISDRKYNVIFSGEIKTSSGQKGLIYWEHLK